MNSNTRNEILDSRTSVCAAEHVPWHLEAWLGQLAYPIEAAQHQTSNSIDSRTQRLRKRRRMQEIMSEPIVLPQTTSKRPRLATPPRTASAHTASTSLADEQTPRPDAFQRTNAPLQLDSISVSSLSSTATTRSSKSGRSRQPSPPKRMGDLRIVNRMIQFRQISEEASNQSTEVTAWQKRLMRSVAMVEILPFKLEVSKPLFTTHL